MWQTALAGMLGILGTFVGGLVEPLRGLLSSRARTRQLRGERSAEVIRAAARIQHDILDLNADYRARAARERTRTREHVFEVVRSLNTAKSDLRQAVALLRLYGPDQLADAGERVIEAGQAMFRLIQAPDDGPHNLAVPPANLEAAARRLDESMKQFASLARRSTR